MARRVNKRLPPWVHLLSGVASVLAMLFMIVARELWPESMLANALWYVLWLGVLPGCLYASYRILHRVGVPPDRNAPTQTDPE